MALENTAPTVVGRTGQREADASTWDEAAVEPIDAREVFDIQHRGVADVAACRAWMRMRWMDVNIIIVE